MLPLDGITVVSLEQAIAAPFATRQLADLGARVIKVERPGTGDFARHYDRRARGLSSHFVWTNRSKESLTLDLKQAEGAAILRRLIARADVLVQNLAPGAAARLGLVHADLAQDNPGLIQCNISGYGSGGPDAGRKAYDLLIQAEAGFLSVTGTPDSPSKAGISIADIAAGMYAHSNILAALLQRGRTGKGCEIDLSMLEAMAEWMGFPLYYTQDGAAAPPRSGADHASIYPYGPFPAGDGQQIILGLQNEREWSRFCAEVLDQPALAADPRFADNSARSDNRSDLRAILIARFAAMTGDQLRDRLDRAGIANARLNDLAGLWTHAQLAARDRWRTVDTPVGPLPALLPPGGLGEPPRMDPVPALGAQTEEILDELGMTPGEIAVLRDRQVI